MSSVYKVILSDEGPTLETLDYILSVLAVHQPFYISIGTGYVFV